MKSIISVGSNGPRHQHRILRPNDDRRFDAVGRLPKLGEAFIHWRKSGEERD